jgi:AAA+ superfamily predicted ATPase
LDLSVIAALAAALETDKDNLALRAHLASLLLDAGKPADALEHLAQVLVREPDNVDALSKAAQAAEAIGETARAESYRRLVDALSWKRTKGLIDSITDEEPPSRPQPREGAARASWSDEARIPLAQSFEGYSDDWDEEPKVGRWETETSNISLKDVAGMEEVKRRLNIAFLAPMKNPDMMKLYGKSLRGGLLLYGPPGCGKTYIARAVAGELGARFLSIGLSDVLDMWIGNSEKNLHEIFETARRNKPCVLFFDEIDALGRKRSLTRDHAGRTVVNQLLAELDNVDNNNDGVFVLAATNHPWDVDAALRRPGRLDRTLLVLPPDQTARKVILDLNLRERPIMPNLNTAEIAAKTDGYSGADVAHLVESAAEYAMEDSIVSGNVRPIGLADFQRAIREITPSARPWFETARNYALFANEGGVYDDLAAYLRANKMV